MDITHLIQDHIKEMSIIQNSFQEFFDEDVNEDYILEEIMQNLTKFNILNDQIKIVSFLRFISILSNNHHRYPSFYTKIQHLLLQIKDKILQQLTNFEIFSIFKKNKLLLLYLFDSKIIIPDEDIALTITFQKYREMNYPQFFWPEFKTFFSKELNEKIEQELSENGIDEETLRQKRKIGENDQFICQLIREDSIADFITYINMKNIPLYMEIKSSIFETNPLLMKNKISLIEYSIFFGSIQTIKYLSLNGVQFESSHWIYAIHSSDPEIISLLESNGIQHPENKIDHEDNCEYNTLLKEAIKCYENESAYYFINNYIPNQLVIKKTYLKSLKYYNYEYFDKDVLKFDLLSFMKLKNTTFCEIFMNAKYVDVNKGIKMKNSDKMKIEQTPLIKAIELNFIDFAQILIQKKQLKINKNINIMQKNDTNNNYEINALSYAIQQNNPEIVQLLLKRKDININNESFYAKNDIKTPLTIAVEKNNSDIFQILMVRNDIKVNNMNNLNKSENIKSLLFLAVENNNIEMVRSLLSNPNININSRGITDSYNKTPLFLAVENGNNEIIQLLLSSEKIDINSFSHIKPKIDLTALHEAVIKNNLKAVQLLLSKDNIDINLISNNYTNGMVNFYGNNAEVHVEIHETALSIAARNKNYSIVNLLLQKNIKPICLNNCYCFDYKNLKTIPNHYIIRTSNNNMGKYYYTKNWIIEGSNDNKTWKTIEEVNDSSFMNENNSLFTIPIIKSNDNTHSFRILRMRTTRICNTNPYSFSIDSFEINQNINNINLSTNIQ